MSEVLLYYYLCDENASETNGDVLIAGYVLIHFRGVLIEEFHCNNNIVMCVVIPWLLEGCLCWFTRERTSN